MKQYEKEARNKLTNLVILNIVCQSLGPSLYRGSTVLNFILFFKKWGGGADPLTVGSGIKTTILGHSGQVMTSTDQAEGTYHQR